LNEKKIIYGGPILTINENQPYVEAVAIEGEKIVAVGNLPDIKNKMGKDFELVNLNGSTLLPGFIDCHLHPIVYMCMFLTLDLSNIRSLKDLQSLLKNKADNSEHNEIIVGLRLNEELFDEPILPNKWDLDNICPKNPVFLLRYDGHTGIANSKALELAGIDKNSINPEGGEIRKNQNGEITGILTENAVAPLLSLAIDVIKLNSEELKEAARKTFIDLAKEGITTIHGILSYDIEGEFGDYGAIEVPILKSVMNNILQNWYALVFTKRIKKLMRLSKKLFGTDKENKKFKINCLKLFLDGTLGTKTACMFEPFSDDPKSCGFCVIDEEEIYEIMKKAHFNDYQIGIHAIGDKGNRIAVDLFKKLLKEFPREDHRHRVEHASILTPDVIKDMKKLGLIASCQPPFINSEYTWLEKRLGKERCKYTYPYKSLIDAGVIIASSSDTPVESPSVIMGLHAMVTRNNFIPEECITIEEALKTYTINGAYAGFEEQIKGSIEVGKLADLVILDKNPLEVPKDEIKTIKVLETIIRGKTVYKMS